jgi:hypothetical protein
MDAEDGGAPQELPASEAPAPGENSHTEGTPGDTTAEGTETVIPATATDVALEQDA